MLPKTALIGKLDFELIKLVQKTRLEKAKFLSDCHVVTEGTLRKLSHSSICLVIVITLVLLTTCGVMRLSKM